MLTGRGVANRTSEAAVNRKPHRLFGRLSERKNPVNAQFVCAKHLSILLLPENNIFPV
jgi:hypothetical protein